MAITIAANLAKKLPIPGSDYSSQQASITITAEVSDLNQVAAEAQKLYRLAEQAVDAQLAQSSLHQAAPQMPAQPGNIPVRPTRPASVSPSASSPPFRVGGRRQQSLASPAQARYLRQLGERNPAALAEVLARNGVGSVEELPGRAASQAIDLILQGAA